MGLVAILVPNAASDMVEGSGVRSRRVRRTLKARMVGVSDMVEASDARSWVATRALKARRVSVSDMVEEAV